MPISKVEVNMDRSALKDAILKEKFWFNKGIDSTNIIINNIITVVVIIIGSLSSSSRSVPDLKDVALVEHTIDEIINGKDTEFMGIIPGNTTTTTTTSTTTNTNAITTLTISNFKLFESIEVQPESNRSSQTLSRSYKLKSIRY
jgi:hypothetical protein